MDKFFHFFVCFFVSLCFGIVAALCDGHLGGAIVAALGTGLGAGLGKEFGDSSSGGRWDWLDVAADAGGIVLAVVLLVVAYFAKG